MTRALFCITISFIILVKLNLKYTSLLYLVPLPHYLRQILFNFSSFKITTFESTISDNPKVYKNYNLIYQLEVMKFLKSIPLIL